MQTSFSLVQLAAPHTAEANAILRRCVHCGFCLATCPTYLDGGNELDSPRGRIYLIKDMLESDKPASAEVALHIDRCLSCLSCMTTCPSGVDYMHLVDRARVRIEKSFRRPFADRFVRNLLALTLPYRGRFRTALLLARLARPFAPMLERLGPAGVRLLVMLKLAPDHLPRRDAARPGRRFPPQGQRRGRVALLTGCAQAVLDPGINAAAIRLLNRLGVEVVLPRGEGCCGAIVHHMGRERQALALARKNVGAWMREIEGEGLDAIVITASGCGTTIKDYGHMLRLDPRYAEKAARVSALALDVTEYVARLSLPPADARFGFAVAYHSACSMQHGQRITTLPKQLLERAGFTVHDIPEGHLCCGSAGTYNLLQPEIATRLRDRKIRNIELVAPDLIATGNIGCMTQLGSAADIPIVHTVELLDWAYGGERPAALSRVVAPRPEVRRSRARAAAN
jgi:glycolate oxidase iron-sulfur subunit